MDNLNENGEHIKLLYTVKPQVNIKITGYESNFS